MNSVKVRTIRSDQSWRLEASSMAWGLSVPRGNNSAEGAAPFMPCLGGFPGASGWPLCDAGCWPRGTFPGLIQQGSSYVNAHVTWEEEAHLTLCWDWIWLYCLVSHLDRKREGTRTKHKWYINMHFYSPFLALPSFARIDFYSLIAIQPEASPTWKY